MWEVTYTSGTAGQDRTFYKDAEVVVLLHMLIASKDWDLLAASEGYFHFHQPKDPEWHWEFFRLSA